MTRSNFLQCRMDSVFLISNTLKNIVLECCAMVFLSLIAKTEIENASNVGYDFLIKIRVLY